MDVMTQWLAFDPSDSNTLDLNVSEIYYMSGMFGILKRRSLIILWCMDCWPGCVTIFCQADSSLAGETGKTRDANFPDTVEPLFRFGSQSWKPGSDLHIFVRKVAKDGGQLSS